MPWDSKTCKYVQILSHTLLMIIALQVLDSVNVNSQELTEARNKYTGRLQKETVEEIVGHKHYETVQVKFL